ncbi:MAG: NAD(+) synthase [Synergistaceae bacterium]|nr:NAD(+) synthase [Synergistaceae bacterium]
MRDGFIKVAAASPELRAADCAYNAERIIETVARAAREGARLLVLPELCVTGYTCGDLFLQKKLIEGAEAALEKIMRETESFSIATLVGLPALMEGKLYNCAAVLCGGALLGLVPKKNLPNYGEFYEKRWFCPAPEENARVRLCGREVPFGVKLLFQCAALSDFRFAAEICEDLWVPEPPSVSHALAGAVIIANLSASDETAGKAEYRRSLAAGQSARLVCAYVYADAGCGESTTDMVFGGHNIIAENGRLLAECAPFTTGRCSAVADLQLLARERTRLTTYPENSARGYETVFFDMEISETELAEREIARLPFVPEDDAERGERAGLILTMQAHALKKRLEHSQSKRAVIGISGGLDSCLALLVAVRAMELAGRPKSDVLAVTMPGFGTTERTRRNAELLCESLGVEFRQIDITEAARLHLRDIGHSGRDYDVTFENSQAPERTQILMDVANMEKGLVVGSGDLSELALGWATYGGDQMSMYGVNSSVPKTLVRHIVGRAAECTENEALRRALLDILDTPVSPELLPPDGENIAQKTEELVGPYELHDFFLYHALRFGFAPRKIRRLAAAAFAGAYSAETIDKWLKSFYRRFFAQQFKRSCMPDGPKIGSVTLSPRGDWRMPSDAAPALWLDDLP